MLKKLCSFTIVTCIQVAVVVLIIALMAPLLLNNPETQKTLMTLLHTSRLYTFAVRCLLYIGVFLLWPKIIGWMVRWQKVKPSDEQINHAMKGRFVFIGALVLLEMVYWLR